MEEKEKASRSQPNNLYNQIIHELQRRGRQIKDYGRYIMAQCIYPEQHAHGDKKPSLLINEYAYKCFSPSCELNKGGSIYDLARRLGIKTGKWRKDVEEEAIRYIMKRLKFNSRDGVLEFMRRMDIRPAVVAGKPGVSVNLFNGDRKFRDFEDDEEKRNVKHEGKAKIPGFSKLVDILDHKAVALCEGTFDALTFWRCGFPALSKEGTKYSLEQVADFLKSVGIRVIYFAFDRDEAGDKFLKGAIKTLLPEGFSFYFLEIPDQYKDVNEFFMNDEEGFLEALKRIHKNNPFKWYIKKNTRMLEDRISQKKLLSKLAIFYDYALDTYTAWHEMIETLAEYGLNIDDWLEMLESIEIQKLNEEKKARIREALEKAKQELEYENMDKVIETLTSNLRTYKTIETKTLKDIKAELLEDINIKQALKTNFFHEILLLPSDMLLITAKTKNGKTTLAMNIAKDFLEQGKRVLYVTYEIQRRILFRLFAGIVHGKHWQELNRQELEEVIEHFGDFFHIEDGLSLSDILAYIRTVSPDVFIIDYDQMIPTSGRFDSEERRISYIVSSLKSIALETGSVWILLSQVNDDDHPRWSREKEFYASVHLHLEKKEEALNCEVKLNRYGQAGHVIELDVDWLTRRVERRKPLGNWEVDNANLPTSTRE